MVVVTFPMVGTKIDAFVFISSSKFLAQAKFTAITPSDGKWKFHRINKIEIFSSKKKTTTTTNLLTNQEEHDN